MNNDNYIVYKPLVEKIKDNKSLIEIKIILLLSSISDSSGKIRLSKEKREEFIQRMKTSATVFSRVLTRLKAEKIIIKIDDYLLISPYYLWTGSLEDRDILLKELLEKDVL